MTMIVFSADFKGTCALCWDTIKPGDMLVTKRIECLGETHSRHVHAECHSLLVDSTDDIDLKEFEMSSVDYH